MAEMLIVDGFFGDRVSCPDYIIKNLDKYIEDFDNWVEVDGRFRVYDPEGEPANEIGRDDVFNWFNDIALKDVNEKITYLEKEYWPSDKEFKTLPVFYI